MGEGADVRKNVTLAIYALVGWAICGATVTVGRPLVSMHATLLIHAVVAPAAFGLLTGRYYKRFPQALAAGTSLKIVGIVVGLDALVVAPFLERSYAMFRSVIGTWVPFASILVTSYLVGHTVGRRAGFTEGGRGARRLSGSS
jgi:hypothetical protein